MVLNEIYLVFTGDGAKEVKGKRINDDYAVTRYIDDGIKRKTGYCITHIKSGLSISKRPYKTIKDALNGFSLDLLEAHRLPDFDERIAVGVRQFEELKNNIHDFE